MKSPISQIINKYKIMKTDDLLPIAREGNADAQLELARRLYSGKGADKSYELAREWFEASAEGGNAEAQYELGVMLVAGVGGDEDYERAVEFFKKSADAGHGGAMFELGAAYAQGRGVKKNYAKATKYLRSSGTEQARAMLNDMPKWWQPAAEQGISEGEYQYGVCFINGYGVAIDYDKGREYIYKAALKNHPKACDAMSQIFANGIGVEADQGKADFWKRKYCEITGTDPKDVGLK